MHRAQKPAETLTGPNLKLTQSSFEHAEGDVDVILCLTPRIRSDIERNAIQYLAHFMFYETAHETALRFVGYLRPRTAQMYVHVKRHWLSNNEVHEVHNDVGLKHKFIDKSLGLQNGLGADR